MKQLASVQQLNVSYKEVHAVKDITFEIEAGEILAVIGANGSGKTSVVECLAGLRKPTAGTLEVFGMDSFSKRKEVFKKLGIQLQENSYPDKLKVEEVCLSDDPNR